MTVPAYLTPAEVADEFRLSEQTLANWRYQGSGPRYFKAGGRVRYARADLDAWRARTQSEAS